MLKKCLTYLVICAFPIMSLIDITPTLIMNLSLADIFVLLLVFVWFLDIRSFKLKKHFPCAWYFLLYALILIISNLYNMHSLVNSSGISGMLSELVKMITNAIFLFVAYNSVSEDSGESKKIFIAWIVGLYIFILYGLYAQISRLSGVQPWMFNRVLGNNSRFLGTLTDANAAALYLSVSFFVVLTGKRYGVKSTGGKLWLNTTIALVLICIGLTMSRGGIAGFLCGLAVWIAFNIKAYIRYICVVPAMLCLVLFVLFIDTRFLSNNVLRQFTARVNDATSENGMLQTRINLSMASVRMGLDHSVIGAGRGNFPLNSEAYLIEQGVNWDKENGWYINMVSHNSIAGVFAEMGFLGLAAFLSLFVLMFVKVLKSESLDRDFKILILALWVSVFVQSLAISLENARVLWIMTGLLLCFTDKKIPFIRERGDTYASINIKTNISITAASLVLCGILYLYVSLRYMSGAIDLSNTHLTLTYQTEQSGQYTLRYYVNTPKSEDETSIMTVSVRREGSEDVLESVQYDATARGYANLYFDANASELFVIDFTGRKVSNISDVKIMQQNAITRVLAGCYPLLPESLYNIFQQKGFLVSQTSDTKTKKTFLHPELLAEESWVALGEKILYKGVDISKTTEGSTRFDFTFDCLEEMEYNYDIWIHLGVDDINALSDYQRPNGYINCGSQRLNLSTDTWQAGMEYKHTYIINIRDGYYNLVFGFWIPPTDGNPAMRLYTTDNNSGIGTSWFWVE